MGLFKKLKKIKLKNVVKTIAKVAPIAAAVIPGVGPVIAAATGVAGGLFGKLANIGKQATQISDVLSITDGAAMQPGQSGVAASSIGGGIPPGLLIGGGLVLLLVLFWKPIKRMLGMR